MTLPSTKVMFYWQCPTAFAAMATLSFRILTRNWLQARLSVYPRKELMKFCKFVKNYFFSIKLLHAHLQYVCNIPTMLLKDTLKALVEVHFTK